MINKILKSNFCLGCGLCSSIIPNQKIIMELGTNGYYRPIVKQNLSKNDNCLINNICPGIHVENNLEGGIWGHIEAACQGWSSNKDIRYIASSGGLVSSIAIYLLETKQIDAILHVGKSEKSSLYNKLLISRTREQIIERAKSIYAPAQVFNDIVEILDNSNDNYCFIGKPCDIVAINNLIEQFPKYKRRIRYKISIFCAGIPSYNATINLCKKSGRTDIPVKIKYRGDGWPGLFEALYEDGTKFQMSYIESWGRYLGRNLCYRCKICPDGIGLSADLAVGDYWNTKDGYPDFKEQDGRSFCIIRTPKGKNIIEEAVENNYIEIRDINVKNLKYLQPYQYNRRRLAGWRILPIRILSGNMLYFKGLSLFKNSLSVPLKEGVIELLGSLKRFQKVNG